jgi:hypothetical protein
MRAIALGTALQKSEDRYRARGGGPPRERSASEEGRQAGISERRLTLTSIVLTSAEENYYLTEGGWVWVTRRWLCDGRWGGSTAGSGSWPAASIATVC